MTAAPNFTLAGSAIASAHKKAPQKLNQMMVENRQISEQAAHFIGSCQRTQIP
jgi:hypothetical protein